MKGGSKQRTGLMLDDGDWDWTGAALKRDIRPISVPALARAGRARRAGHQRLLLRLPTLRRLVVGRRAMIQIQWMG